MQISMSEMSCIIDFYFDRLTIPKHDQHLYSFELTGINGMKEAVVKVSKWLNGRNPAINIWNVERTSLTFYDKVEIPHDKANDFCFVLNSIYKQAGIRILNTDVRQLTKIGNELLVSVKPESLRFKDTLKIKLV